METESEEIRQERIRLTLEKHQPGHDLEQPMTEELKDGQKICPFSGKPCREDCKLYRPEKKGYECYFMELQSVSWLMSKAMELLKKFKN